MQLLRSLYQRWRSLIRELAAFGIIGLINSGLDIALYNLFLPVGNLKAKVLATIISATSSYFMNRHWTFRHRARSGLRREYTLFFAFNAIGLAIQLVCIALTTYGLGYDGRLAANIATVIGLVLGTLFRFWSYRRWVFLHTEDTLYATDDDVAPQDATSGRDDDQHRT